MVKKALNFKSQKSYKKWLAFGHASGDFKRVPGNQKIKIRGKKHKVQHGKSRKKKKNK